MQAITASNVISSQEYKKMVLEVLGFAGSTVSRTLGPCANTSIIEEMGPLVASKDGFHTLTRIRFAAQDIFANNVMRVIVNMAHRMVNLVGDGSSSATVAAWKFAEIILSSDAKATRPRDLNKAYKKAIELITEKIRENATPVTQENLGEVVYNTALVSTNGDVKFAEMMKKIYEDNGSGVVFHVEKSPVWASETTYGVIDGYKANKYYMIDPIFHNTPGEFLGRDVNVVCFDMALNGTHFDFVQHILQLIAREEIEKEKRKIPRETIIFAPDYDQTFLDKLKRDIEMQNQLIMAKSIAHYRARYARALMVNAWQRNDYMDFCLFTGSNPITAQDFNKMVDLMEGTTNYDDELLKTAIGRVNRIRTHTNEYTIISGFPKRDEVKFKSQLEELEAIYEREAPEEITRRVPSMNFIMLKKRRERLKSRIIEIAVGADNEYEMTLNVDAADDATLACESVTQFGYNVGGNLAIMIAVDDLLNEFDVESEKGGLTSEEDKMLFNALEAIFGTFRSVLREVFANKFGGDGYDKLDEDTKRSIDDSVMECVNRRCMYDIIKGEFNENIINSSRTDVEILKGAISSCLTLMTANQYLSSIPQVEANGEKK